MSAKTTILTITQDFTADRAYTTGETVEVDALNGENWVARGYALPGDVPVAAPAEKPKSESRVRRKRRKLSEPLPGDDNA